MMLCHYCGNKDEYAGYAADFLHAAPCCFVPMRPSLIVCDLFLLLFRVCF